MPSGLNFAVKTSPAWPDSSMMGASRADVLSGPCILHDDLRYIADINSWRGRRFGLHL